MTAAPYDVAEMRAQFPALSSGAVHFDGPGGSQVPKAVADAIGRTLTAGLSNRGVVTPAERLADSVVTEARLAMADLLGADPQGIVFGRSMTQLTFDMAHTLAVDWRPGDEIVVSRLDHDANIRPWVLAAEAAGATVRWAEFDPDTGELPVGDVAAVLSPATRLIAVTAASNLIGTRPAVAEISALAHRVGALCYVDGVHVTAHGPVDVAALGADFFLCSPYKFLGPHCGVLAARPELLATLRPQKLLPSSDLVPERFELGTLPYELLTGTTAAVEFLAAIGKKTGADRRQQVLAGMSAVQQHESALRRVVEDGLGALPGVLLHSRAGDRTPTLLVTFRGRESIKASEFLAMLGVYAPAGSFYALEASRHLGLGDGGGLRIGLAPYTDSSDVDRLLTGLHEFLSKEFLA